MIEVQLAQKIPYVYTEKGLMDTKKILDQSRKGLLADSNHYDAPLNVTLELVGKCNQRCIHCYNNSGAGYGGGELSVEEWKSVCRQLGKMKVFSCTLSGGEPLILKDQLFEIMDELDQFNISLGINTNGLLLDHELMQQLKPYKLEWIQISMDGACQETHNYIRGIDCWRRTIEAANFVKHSGVPLVISYVVNKKNYQEISEAVDISYWIGAKKMVFTLMEITGRAEGVQELQLSDDECEYIYQEIRNKNKQYDRLMKIQVIPESLLVQQLQLGKGNDTLLIRPDGKVKFSCFMPFIIGDIKNNDLDKIWKDRGKHIWQHDRIKDYVLRRVNQLAEADLESERQIPIGEDVVLYT